MKRAPDVYRAPVRTMHDTIEETVFFNDRYYSETSDLVDETSLSQYDLELTEPKEYSRTTNKRVSYVSPILNF